MKGFLRFSFVWSALAALACSVSMADVTLPAVISDNMVLQADHPNPIWGWAEAGEAVTVKIGGQEKTTQADEKGAWKVTLDPIPAGQSLTLTVNGKNEVTASNILVGEVWVCSGQSNMEWSVDRSANPEQEIAAANHPNIRVFFSEKAIASQPRNNIVGQWLVVSPETIAKMTAVGYFFGRELHKELNVPIGLIQTAWGGTPSESWTTKEALASHEVSVPIIERWDKQIAEFPDVIKKYCEELNAWVESSSALEAAGEPVSTPPAIPRDPRAHPHRYSGLYNAMIHPFIPYGIRGAIWYQGESNASRAYQYRTIFPMMIEDWRKQWGQGDFPFYFVQLANFMEVHPEPRDHSWAELREAQTMALSLPNTGMAVIIDIGEADDIHPRNKQDVGKRLALNALAKVHGREVAHTGPLYRSMEVEGDKIRIHFNGVHGGLKTPNGEPIKGFAVAGADRKFVWADAKIEGDEVVVSSASIAEPVAVRYAWDANPVCNLFDGAGLPASPFRTDVWPGVTDNER